MAMGDQLMRLGARVSALREELFRGGLVTVITDGVPALKFQVAATVGAVRDNRELREAGITKAYDARARVRRDALEAAAPGRRPEKGWRIEYGGRMFLVGEVTDNAAAPDWVLDLEG